MILLLPILVPILGGILVFRVKTEKLRNQMVFVLAVFGILFALLVCALPETELPLLTIYGDLKLSLCNDRLSKFFLALFACIWMPVTIFSFPYIRHAGRGSSFFGFYVMALGILAGLAMANNFVTLYMFFELMSFFTMPLVLHDATPAARRAGFQYLGYSVFGAGMALAGYFFLANYLSDPDFLPGGSLNLALAAEHSQLLLVVYFLMIVGFGAKAGLMPMQAWLPAAHPVAPAPASAVLSGVITKGGVLAIIRVTYYMFDPAFLAGSWAQSLLLILALATVFTGSMLAYRERLLKRRLAYSTVSQVSYVLFGLLLFTAQGVGSALMQAVYHAAAKDLLFLAAGAIIYATGFTHVDQLSGIGKQMPATMACFTIASLSLIGIPPMAGFVSKWYLVLAGLESPYPGFGVAGLVLLILSALLTAGYLMPLVTNGFFPGKGYIAKRREVGWSMIGPMLFFALACLVLGLLPGGLRQWTEQLAQQLFR